MDPRLLLGETTPLFIRLLHSQDVDLFNCLGHIHSMAHRYKPDQTPDEVLVTILTELKRVRLGIPEATAAVLKPGNSCCRLPFSSIFYFDSSFP